MAALDSQIREVSNRAEGAAFVFRRKQTIWLILIVTLVTLAFTLVPGLLRSTNLPLPFLNNLQNPVRLENFYPTESNGREVFRWTDASAKIFLPEVLTPHKIKLEVAAAYPENSPRPRLKLVYAGQELGNWQVQSNWQTIEVAFPATFNLATAPLEFSIENALAPRKGDTRTLGVAVRSADLQVSRVAPVGLILTTLILALTLLLYGRWLKFGLWQSLVISLGPALVLSIYWQYDRFYSSILVGWLSLAAALITLLAQVSSIKEKSEVGSRKSEALTENRQPTADNFSNNQQLTTNNSAFTDNQQLTTHNPSQLPTPNSQLPTLFSCFLLLGFVFWEYGRTLDYQFHWDDYHIARTWTIGEVLGTFAGSWDALGLEPAYYRPLTVVSFALDWATWGYNAWGYHLTNLLLHALAAILLFTLLRKLKFWWLAAFGGALLYIILPTNVAAATWISERSDSLAAIFILAGTSAFISFAQSSKLGWLIFANFCLILALCSKEIAVSLPLLFALALLLFQNSQFSFSSIITSSKKPNPASSIATPINSQLATSNVSSNNQQLTTHNFVPIVNLVPSFLILFLYLGWRGLVLPGAGGGNAITPGNLWDGFHSAVYQSFYGWDDYLSGKAAPWLTLTLLGSFGLILLFGRNATGGWRGAWFGLGWLLISCAPLAFLGASYTVTTRVLYLPEAGYCIGVAAGLNLLMGWISNNFRNWRGWLGLILLGFVLIAPYNSLHRDNLRAQRDYAPTSFNTLRWDEWIYNNPAWKAKIPERHFQTIEQKLRDARKIK